MSGIPKLPAKLPKAPSTALAKSTPSSKALTPAGGSSRPTSRLRRAAGGPTSSHTKAGSSGGKSSWGAVEAKKASKGAPGSKAVKPTAKKPVAPKIKTPALPKGAGPKGGAENEEDEDWEAIVFGGAGATSSRGGYRAVNDPRRFSILFYLIVLAVLAVVLLATLWGTSVI